MQELKIGADEFSQLKRAFMGGHTHANANYVDKVIERVGSHDITSSYPSVMLLEKFPMSASHTVDGPMTRLEFENHLKFHACLFDVIFTGINAKLNFEHPIPRSKCWKCENPIVDNGRIVEADLIGITVTEQDYFTYSEFYDWDEISIANFRWYDKQYLPKAFAKAVIGLYEKKTVLKDVVGEEVNYMISKNMMNSAFGMAVTNPVRDEIKYENGEYVKIKPVLEEAISAYNENVRRFLFYPWGVWITAYARRNLFKMIEALGEDYIYADTDSTKYLHPDKHLHQFEEANEQIKLKIGLSQAYYGFDYSQYSPLNSKGEEKTIGVWDFEGIYDEFKTLGAKRYMYRVDDDYRVTLAGANKRRTAEYLVSTSDPFGNFAHDLRIPPTHSGRLTATYIDDEYSGDVVDYTGKPYHYHELSAIHMEPSEYNMKMSDEFINYLKGVRDLGDLFGY